MQQHVTWIPCWATWQILDTRLRSAKKRRTASRLKPPVILRMYPEFLSRSCHCISPVSWKYKMNLRSWWPSLCSADPLILWLTCVVDPGVSHWRLPHDCNKVVWCCMIHEYLPWSVQSSDFSELKRLKAKDCKELKVPKDPKTTAIRKSILSLQWKLRHGKRVRTGWSLMLHAAIPGHCDVTLSANIGSLKMNETTIASCSCNKHNEIFFGVPRSCWYPVVPLFIVLAPFYQRKMRVKLNGLNSSLALPSMCDIQSVLPERRSPRWLLRCSSQKYAQTSYNLGPLFRMFHIPCRPRIPALPLITSGNSVLTGSACHIHIIWTSCPLTVGWLFSLQILFDVIFQFRSSAFPSHLARQTEPFSLAEKLLAFSRK